MAYILLACIKTYVQDIRRSSYSKSREIDSKENPKKTNTNGKIYVV